MNEYRVAQKLVKALKTDPKLNGIAGGLTIFSKAESLKGWGKDGVRICLRSGSFDPWQTQEQLSDWFLYNAPDYFAEHSDGGETITIYKF